MARKRGFSWKFKGSNPTRSKGGWYHYDRVTANGCCRARHAGVLGRDSSAPLSRPGNGAPREGRWPQARTDIGTSRWTMATRLRSHSMPIPGRREGCCGMIGKAIEGACEMVTGGTFRPFAISSATVWTSPIPVARMKPLWKRPARGGSGQVRAMHSNEWSGDGYAVSACRR